MFKVWNISLVLLCIFFVLVASQSIPSDWEADWLQSNLLWSAEEPKPLGSSLSASVGNGYVATVIGSDTVYIGGVFNGFNTTTPSHRARFPSYVNVSISGWNELGCALDLKKSAYYRRGSVQNLEIEQKWFAHSLYRRALVMQVQVMAGSNETNWPVLEFESGSGGPSGDLNLTLVKQEATYQVFEGSILEPETPTSAIVKVAFAVTLVTSFTRETLTNNSWWLLSVYRTSLEPSSSSLAELVEQEYLELYSEREGLWQSHEEEWEGKHGYHGIYVACDSASSEPCDLAQAVNASLFYLNIATREDWSYSLSPGGLASNSYNGHTFWDCETWMFPTLALLYPNIAMSLLEYRYLRIPGASAKAASYSPPFSGTMFPWESAFTGEEVCPVSAPTGLLEQHISGDIAFAIRQLWWLQGNLTWMTARAYPLLQGIAEFWTSKVSYHSQNQYYEILHVIPPDEYAVNVNNSVYTNSVAKIALEFAVEAATLIYAPNPPPPEVESWAKIASEIVILFDEKSQVHPEYEGYNGQTIKQADVVLLGYPLEVEMPESVRRKDLEYYSERTDPNGPAMTWSMHVVAWLELGESLQAAKIFGESYANIHGPFKVWYETPTGGAVNFITGAGGFLQGIWAGYFGLRIHSQQLTFAPVLPLAQVVSLQLASLQYLGNSLSVTFTNSSASVSLLPGPLSTLSDPPVPLQVTTQEGSHRLTEGVPLEFPVGSFSIEPATSLPSFPL